MEVYEAKFDYRKQRKDVLSFDKGDQFYIIDKPNNEWWSARKLSDDAFGYVPVIYLEKSKEQIIGRLIPEGRRNTHTGPMTKREHDIHLQALAELHQRVKPLPAHVLGQALGMDVPKETAPPAPHHAPPNQRQKILIPDLQIEEPSQPEERLRSPPPPVMLVSPTRSPRNSFKQGRAPSPTPIPKSHTPRSPSPQPFPKPKSRNGSFQRPEDSLPYHHKCIAADRHEDEDEEDELPPHLRTTPPPPVSSPPPPDYDLDDDVDTNGVPYHHRLNNSGRLSDSGRFVEIPEDSLHDAPPTMSPTLPPNYQGEEERGLISPKPLHNPVASSQVHRSLHRELKTSGRKVLNTDNELKKVFRDRSQRQTKKAMDAERDSRRTSFDIKLQERLNLEEKEGFQNLEALEKAAREPEFMKVQLKPRTGSGKS